MGDVIQFEPRIELELEAEQIATCDCGCQLWFIRSNDDGCVSEFECQNCGVVFEAKSGKKKE